jgi:putative Holliday junction resolvase
VSVLLGLDLGDRRIGVACADTASGAVLPLLTLRRGTPQQDAEAVQRLCVERGADAVVVGLPLHLDGSESDQSRLTRDWAAAVGPRLAVPLTFRDERSLGRPPRGASGGAPSPAARRAWRARIDREAAAAILQRELDARAPVHAGVAR